MSKDPGNFAFLAMEWPAVYQSARQAETQAHADPRVACFYARRALEQGVDWLYQHDDYLQRPLHSTNLAALLHEQTFKENLDPGLFPKLLIIQKLGNRAVHEARPVPFADALQVLRELHHFCYFLFRYYSSEKKQKPGPFEPALLPQPPKPQPQTSPKIVQDLEARLQEQDQALQDKQNALHDAQSQIEQLKAELARIQRIKEQNQRVPESHDYNEAETRLYLIDVLLQEAGWVLSTPQNREYPVVGMPTPSGKGRVDYVLWGEDGLPMALVEAKRTSKDVNEGKTQAQLYADCLEQMTGQRPLIFYTNGFEHWFWDDKNYPARSVQGFYSPESIERLLKRRQLNQPLKQIPIQETIVNRHYQHEAIRRITESFERKHRKALVVMATGTGKTRTVVALTEILMRQDWVQRVLFLADRTALVKQAQRAFQKHLPQVSTQIVSNQTDDAFARINFSTHKTMLNAISNGRFSVGHFDLIVIDEAHRSVYQKYHYIFEYFDALLVGLTATPRDEVDRNTYGLFELESGIPTFAYESDQAFKDGVLVPPKTLSVPLKFQREGIQYKLLSVDEQAEYELLFGDETEAMPSEIDANALNQWLFNQDTVDKVIQFLMEQGLKVEGGDRLGKTIVFARKHEHAVYIEKRFNAHFPQYKGTFARVIDNYEPYAESLLDKFTQPEDEPVIAISVDMLDTGIDVPSILNLVFFKRVYSKTKFFQMLGRGTRLCPDLFGPGQDKTEFLVLDFCQNFEFFENCPEGLNARLAPSLHESLFMKRARLLKQLQTQASSPLLQSHLEKDLLQYVQGMDPNQILIRPARAHVEPFQTPQRWRKLTDSDLLDLSQHVAALPSQAELGTEAQRRWDLLCLNLQMAVCLSQPLQRETEKVKNIAAQLEGKQSIPAVRHMLPLLEEIQGDFYWQSIAPEQLEKLRLSLRPLVNLLDKAERQSIVYTDFQDEIGLVVEKSIPYFEGAQGLKRYREKVKTYLLQHQDHIALQRLRHNYPVTPQDLESLEAMLFSAEEVGGLETFTTAFGADFVLGKLIRQLVGLDREAAKQAFSEYLVQRTLTSNQIHFINEMINYLTENGVMDVARLYEPPFTKLHELSLDGLFSMVDADKIVSIIEKINQNSQPNLNQAI